MFLMSYWRGIDLLFATHYRAHYYIDLIDIAAVTYDRLALLYMVCLPGNITYDVME